MTSSSPTLSVGPATQTQLQPIVYNLPATVPPNGAINSNLVAVSGYTKVAAGLTSSQAGLLSIQRYLDSEGAVAVGAPSSIPLVAGTPASLTVNDGQMFGSFQLTVTNAASTTALLANVAVAVGADPTSETGAGTGSYETATSTDVAVPASVGGAILLGQNLNAKYRALRNPVENTDSVWLTLGANPVVGQGLIDLRPGDLYEMSVTDGNLYQGVITAIANTGTQSILVTEGV